MPEKVKPAPAPSWLKSVEAIAAAMGLQLYAQRPKKLAQLAAVRALTEAAGFPAKVKGYWPRAEVLDFIAARVGVCKNGREFKVSAAPRPKPRAQSPPPVQDSDAQRHATKQKDLPQQSSPAAEDDLFLNESAEAKMNRRLDLLEDKYFFPEKYPESKIAKFEIDELKRERPWLWTKGGAEGGADAVSENISGGVRGVANHIRNNFPGVICDHMSISRWLRGEYLPPGCKENFPPADEGNRYKTALVKSWVEKYLVKSLVGQVLALNIQEERDKAELEEIAHQRWQRELERGEYIARPLALATGIAAVRQIHQIVKVEDERTLPKMRREHLTTLLNAETIPSEVVARVVAAFAAYDIEQARGVTDRREHAMATVGNAKQVKLLEEKLRHDAVPISSPLPAEGKLAEK